MTSYVQTHGEMKNEHDEEEKVRPVLSQPVTLRSAPRLSFFTGTLGRKEEATYGL